jgi:hypothetical protein
MASAVANKIFEAANAFEDDAIDSAVERRIRELASKQTILPPSGLLESENVGSSIVKLLVDNQQPFLSTPGMAHVLYAPSSTGKSTGLRYFLQVILKKANEPALMISRNANVDDYLENIATVLSIREGREG